MPDAIPPIDTIKTEPVTPESAFPNEGTSTQDFECMPWIDKKAGKEGSKITKPKDMPQSAWEKHFEQGYLRA
jgi:hypothetical protein